MTRVIELIEDVQEKISSDVLDLKTGQKTIAAGCIGVVIDTVVPGHSIYVNFGRGIGVVVVSERVVKDLASDTNELIEYLGARQNHHD